MLSFPPRQAGNVANVCPNDSSLYAQQSAGLVPSSDSSRLHSRSISAFGFTRNTKSALKNSCLCSSRHSCLVHFADVQVLPRQLNHAWNQMSGLPSLGPELWHFDLPSVCSPQHGRQKLGKSVPGAVLVIVVLDVSIQLCTSHHHRLATNSLRLRVIQECLNPQKPTSLRIYIKKVE